MYGVSIHIIQSNSITTLGTLTTETLAYVCSSSLALNLAEH